MTEIESRGPRSESDRLSDAIARDIEAGELPPGLWLKQIDIETRYAATRNTTRSALTKLALKRFIEHEPNRGYRIPLVDARKRDEIMQVRVILETAAVPDLVKNIAQEAITQLRGLARDFSDLVVEGEYLRLISINRNFHHKLYSSCGNAELIRLIEDMRQTIEGIPGMAWTSREMMEQSAIEHHLMVDALEKGDTHALMSLTAQHIAKGSRKDMLVVVPTRC